MVPNEIKCPLLQKLIDSGYCLEISDAVDGILKKDALKDDITKIKDFKAVCQNCKYHQ